MNWNFRLRQLPTALKRLVLFFLTALLFGYGASFWVLADQTELTPNGIEESYNGNEDNENATTIKFRKSKFEVLTTVHSHVFTLGMLFLLTGFLVYFTDLQPGLRQFLMIEPPISLIISFSSLIMMWQGYPIFKYLAYLSGALMHSTFIIGIILIIREVLQTRKV